jgi:Uma2 family endonuclease
MRLAVKRTKQHVNRPLPRELVPRQGNFTEEQYLALTDHMTRLVEFTDGYLERLPRPTTKHQRILAFLYRLFFQWLGSQSGLVVFAPLRLRIRSGKFREPDLLALCNAGDPRCQDRFWTGADVVLEVVSADKPKRDLVDKRHDFAEGRVPEFRIVNPRDESITVLRLRGKRYKLHGHFRRGQIATSALLSGFAVNVSAVFDAV